MKKSTSRIIIQIIKVFKIPLIILALYLSLSSSTIITNFLSGQKLKEIIIEKDSIKLSMVQLVKEVKKVVEDKDINESKINNLRDIINNFETKINYDYFHGPSYYKTTGEYTFNKKDIKEFLGKNKITLHQKYILQKDIEIYESDGLVCLANPNIYIIKKNREVVITKIIHQDKETISVLLGCL